MLSRIEELPTTLLIGMHREISFAKNTTVELWQCFMPRRMEIPNRTNTSYISMNVYKEGLSGMLSPTTVFDKWASVAVSSHEEIPDSMEAYTLQTGKYAVFIHKGPASAFPKTMQYIFVGWFPESGFEIDDREHFEVLPEGYDRNDPEAKEEVWIPIK